MPSVPDQQGFLRRAHRFLVYFGGVYAAVLVLLTVPDFQRHLVFLHKLRWPLNADFGRPEKYGLAPQRALNVNITTSDNVHLGAWFILADTFYQDAYRTAPSPSAVLAPESLSAALRRHPTVLYFHGNAGTRAVSFRVAAYKAYTTRLQANVLAVDYRGFADSGGTPTEEGVIKDARAAWEWAVDRGARAEDLVLVGQSLGTGVAAQLAQELAAEGKRPRGVVLIAPYSSMRTLLETYNILGWLPLLKPLQTIPIAQNLVLKFLRTKFDTKAALQNVKTDIILLHAKDDFDIPLSHSVTLFDTLLEPSLPPSVMTMEELREQSHIPEKWSEWLAGEESRHRVRADVVQVDEIEGFGRMSRFQRSRDEGKVLLIESLWGGHDRVGYLEGVVDAVGRALIQRMTQPQSQKDPASRAATSYVYPVRTMLTGIHAPVPSSPPRAPPQNAHGPDYFDKHSLQSIANESKPQNEHPNFRHYPAEHRGHQSFASQPQSTGSDSDPVSQTVVGPAGEMVSYIPNITDEMSLRHPQPISAVGAQALSDGQLFCEDSDSVFGISSGSLASAGLVHLTPIRPNSQLTDMTSARGSPHCGDSSQVAFQSSPPGQVQSVNDRGSTDVSSVQGFDSQGHPTSSAVSESSSNLRVDPQEPLVTVRFEHVQDEHGHHVIVGREGKLTKCEDEPICVPGAVQGFGVLVALQEEVQTGNLVVRQVSENTSELLCLSPQYLFSLNCFTHILPASQADILWDNIQYLSEQGSEDADNAHDGPQVFLLSGWSEPGATGSKTENSDQNIERRSWTCWCAAHRPLSNLIVLEFELEHDVYNPLYPPFQGLPRSSSRDSCSADAPGSSTVGPASSDGDSAGTFQISPEKQKGGTLMSQRGLQGDDSWHPNAEDILESTTSGAKPLRALERMRHVSCSRLGGTASAQRGSGIRVTRSIGVGTMDVFAVLSQINDQLASAPDLDSFLKVVVGVIKDLTQFHRVLVYQFDEAWNGQVVAELVDWNQTHDLYKGLHFPASDIPAQARALYVRNKVRLLYDRSQTTARLVVRSRRDLHPPLDMTHSYLRAMSPIHVKYLGNMGVRASMSISIVTFGVLWGLITCHSYGDHGMRVSFPVRQMLSLLSDSISRNIERLSYAQRLHTRKLISTLPTDSHPTGCIVSNAEDLLSLFDADFGVLVVGEGAKILGPNRHGQEILLLAEYLRLKQFALMQVSQAVTADFPDLVLPMGLEVIAGLLYVPLSSGGKDFIVFLRKGQIRDVHWAGKPFKETTAESEAVLEPRKSFKMWSETIVGRCRAWTDEQLETAGVLALVYGKFIEVWRQKETALQTTQLTNLLLSNASHEVRTPLNHIINYLELALDGQLDGETRENLTRSHTASKSLLFTINDLLDLTRLESGNETSFNEPFDLQATIHDAVQLYRIEAVRRGLEFRIDTTNSPQFVIGDLTKIRTLVSNLCANAIKYTSQGSITVECHKFLEPPGLRTSEQVAVEVVVADTGCGIPENKLENMFREFEQVESMAPKPGSLPGLGLGLAVVARIVEQLGGQLRIDSKLGQGSMFSFLIPFALYAPSSAHSGNAPSVSSTSQQSGSNSEGSVVSEIESLVEALSTDHMRHSPKSIRPKSSRPRDGTFPVVGSKYPVRSVKMDEFELDKPHPGSTEAVMEPTAPSQTVALPRPDDIGVRKLKILVVDDDPINRRILSKRLSLDGHTVQGNSNGQEAVQTAESDRTFDCVLMDIQMPILDGFEATKQIRALEASSPLSVSTQGPTRLSFALNGRIPIFAVSASLAERQREDLCKLGFDGWILKPIDFKRLGTILRGITDVSQRDVYQPGWNWEAGGWLPVPRTP